MRHGTVGTALYLALAAACAPQPGVPAAPIPAPIPPPAPVLPLIRMNALPTLLDAEPPAAGFDARLPARVDSIVAAAIAEGAAPGAAVAVGRHGRLVLSRGYGRTGTEPDAPPVTDRTIFDLASVSKVVGTTTAAMLLEEQGRLELDRPVASYLAELDDPAKAGITVRMLLTHTGGLEAFAPLFQTLRGRDAYLRAINQRPLKHPPGTETIYSDWDLILLQMIVERISGQPLDDFLRDRVFGPLGMTDTGYAPAPALRARVAPTELDAQRGRIHGEVHDPNAWAIGGVAGHAGLFSTARDLSVFAQMMLNGGSYGGVRILSPATIARWTATQQVGSSRALGWDTPSGQSSAGRHFSPRSFGHTGYTGTSLWIDPERGLFLVLLTNRVYFTSQNQRHVPLRRAVADAVQSSILDAPLVDWEGARE